MTLPGLRTASSGDESLGEAQYGSASTPRGSCAYQRRMDRDNDGRACERISDPRPPICRGRYEPALAERFGIKRTEAGEFFDELQQLTEQELLRCGAVRSVWAATRPDPGQAQLKDVVEA